MKSLGLLSWCLALFAFGVFGASALDLRKLERIVIFGDSLSDTGNLFALTQREDPPPPYGDTFDGTKRVFPGRFTDGQNWVDYFPLVAQHFPLPVAFYQNQLNPNATNFAVGAATSTNLLQQDPSGIPGQLPTYFLSNDKKASPDNLYVIWIGANDFAAGINPQVSVDNIREAVEQLSSAGAKTFVVVNVPDISLTPEVKALGPAATVAAKEFVISLNVLLEVELPLVAFSHRVTVELVDINRIFVPVVFNPAKFGFSNSVGAAFNLSTGQLATEPNDYVFWDGFHPTTNVHRLAAEFIFAALSSKTPRLGFERLDRLSSGMNR